MGRRRLDFERPKIGLLGDRFRGRSIESFLNKTVIITLQETPVAEKTAAYQQQSEDKK